MSTILQQRPRRQAKPAGASAQRELLVQRYKALLTRHLALHPSDTANIQLLERQIAQAEQVEQPRTERQPAIQEAIPADAYIFVPGRQARPAGAQEHMTHAVEESALVAAEMA